jgi:ribose transport system permease protein
VNGLLVTRGQVNSLIVTLGVSTIIAGLVTWKTGGNSIITGLPASMTEFGTRNVFGLPALCYVLVVVAAVTYYLLVHTPFGRYLYAVGSNSTAAKLVGLRVDGLTLLSFVASGTLAGAAGVLEVARTGTGNPQIGPNYTLPALAAAFLSAAAINPGRFNVGGTLVAIFFLASLTSGLNLAGVQDYVSDLVYGTALIAGIGLAAWLARRRGVGGGVL